MPRADFDPNVDDGLHIMAIDPGGTTGYVTGWLPTENILNPAVNLWDDAEVQYGQVTGDENEQASEIQHMLSGMHGAVVIEDFILRQFRMDRALLSPVRITAIIEHHVWMINGARYAGGTYSTNPDFRADKHIQADLKQRRSKRLTVFKQQPSLAKSTMTDDRLKEVGLWTEGGMPHARDANRHLATFLRRAKADRKIAIQAWPWIEQWYKA